MWSFLYSNHTQTTCFKCYVSKIVWNNWINTHVFLLALHFLFYNPNIPLMTIRKTRTPMTEISSPPTPAVTNSEGKLRQAISNLLNSSSLTHSGRVFNWKRVCHAGRKESWMFNGDTWLGNRQNACVEQPAAALHLWLEQQLAISCVEETYNLELSQYDT